MKKIIVVMMMLVMSLGIVGCTTASSSDMDDSVSISIDSVSNSNDSLSNSSDKDADQGGKMDSEDLAFPTDDIPVGDTIIIGEIMGFDGKYIHIISGDLVMVYAFDDSNVDEFYINQTVELIKEEKGNILKPYILEDFSSNHTNMGQLLNALTGKLVSVDDKSMTLEVDGEEITISTYEQVNAMEGSIITAVYGDFGDLPSLVYMLNEDSKLILTVKGISRSDAGHMMLNLVDADGGEYNTSISNELLEVNLSDISIGDELTFYHEGIMESWPMQIATVLIRK